jgi:hypothetical protein
MPDQDATERARAYWRSLAHAERSETQSQRAAVTNVQRTRSPTEDEQPHEQMRLRL